MLLAGSQYCEQLGNKQMALSCAQTTHLRPERQPSVAPVRKALDLVESFSFSLQQFVSGSLPSR